MTKLYGGLEEDLSESVFFCELRAHSEPFAFVLAVLSYLYDGQQ